MSNFTVDQREVLNDEYSKMIYRNEQLQADLDELNKLYDNLMKEYHNLQNKYDMLIYEGDYYPDKH